MNKIISWIFIIIGVIYLLPLITLDFLEPTISSWLIMLGFLIIGILMLTDKK